LTRLDSEFAAPVWRPGAALRCRVPRPATGSHHRGRGLEAARENFLRGRRDARLKGPLVSGKIGFAHPTA
jgi:hypothetical protein